MIPTQASDIPHEVNRRQMFVVQCPTCTHQSPSHSYKFQCEDLDAKIKCTVCLKFSAIKHWKCNCGELWHTCKVHFCIEKVKPTSSKDELRTSGSNEGASKAISKRLLSNASFDQLLDDDLRAQTKRAKICDKDNQWDNLVVPARSSVQIRSSMLSPNLRERFAHLLSD